MMALVTCDYFDGEHSIDISCMKPAQWIIDDNILSCYEHLHLFIREGQIPKPYNDPTHQEII
jgi:hypothetical protein